MKMHHSRKNPPKERFSQQRFASPGGFSVWDQEKKQWIAKEDVGTESNVEREKGLASDSFKRAAVNWGVGRELYTAPDIVIWASNGGVRVEERNGRWTVKDRFRVGYITYDASGAIKQLAIVNQNGEIVYRYNC